MNVRNCENKKKASKRLKKITHVSSFNVDPSHACDLVSFLTHIALHNWSVWLVSWVGWQKLLLLLHIQQKKDKN
jgi:hypothetical protein